MLPDNRPIGVFDSGVGGLTVLEALQERLPGESTVYLGDLARCPYGPRPQDEVRRFAIQVGDLLAAEEIKLLVVACNTATAAAYSRLRERYDFPVIGVIEPGADAATRRTRNGRIGVVATDGTVASGAYTSAISSRFPGAVVVERSASWLVPLIERGPIARATVAIQLAPTLLELREESIDTLILGCTHFPLVRDIFQAEIGAEIPVIDSAATTAEAVARMLVDLDLASSAAVQHRLLVTGMPEAFTDRARAMFRASPSIETIDLALDFVV
jgi:glutamate racemase